MNRLEASRRALLPVWAFQAALLLTAIAAPWAPGQEPAFQPRLRIALTSNRDQYFYPRIVLYDHDGESTGRVAKVLTSAEKRLDHQPTLSTDGRRCAYGWEAEAGVGQIRLWDVTSDTAIELGELNRTDSTVFSPSLSAAGDLLAFTAWSRAGASRRWDVVLWDIAQRKSVPLPNLNSQKYDERRVALSGDGQMIAFTTNHVEGRGLTDIWLYDRSSGTIDRLPAMNSEASESYPSLNHDGSLVAFISERRTGAGGMDVYLYDRGQQALVTLPDLNSPGQEQTPALSGSGRYLVFVSERFNTGGEHDVFLYDRAVARLLDTPELNSPRDDYDPAIVELSGSASSP